MPFKKINAKEIIYEKCQCDAEFNKSYSDIKKEYSFIREIVKTRKEMGLTQESLAKRIGVKQQVISRFEQEKNIPNLDSLLKIVDGLGLEIRLHKKPEFTLN